MEGGGVAEVSIIDVSDDKVRVRCKIIGRTISTSVVERIVDYIEKIGGKVVVIGNRYEFFLVFDVGRNLFIG